MAAKKPSQFGAAPIPVQVTIAKKLFISYRESDADPGARDLTDNEFYGLIKDWGNTNLWLPLPMQLWFSKSDT